MRVRLSERAKRVLRKMEADQRRAAQDALATFIQNPRHPGLHFEKLSGFRSLHTIRMSRGWRIFLRATEEPDLFDVIDLGPHDLYDRRS